MQYLWINRFHLYDFDGWIPGFSKISKRVTWVPNFENHLKVLPIDNVLLNKLGRCYNSRPTQNRLYYLWVLGLHLDISFVTDVFIN